MLSVTLRETMPNLANHAKMTCSTFGMVRCTRVTRGEYLKLTPDEAA